MRSLIPGLIVHAHASPASRALLQVVKPTYTNPLFTETVDSIKRKYTETIDLSRRWATSGRFDPYSATETCAGIDGPISLGAIKMASDHMVRMDATILGDGATSQKVEVTYRLRCGGPDFVEYILSNVVSEKIKGAPKMLCVSPLVGWNRTRPKKIPLAAWGVSGTSRCHKVQFIVSEVTGPLLKGFVDKEEVFGVERFKGVLSFGVKLIQLLKALHEMGIVHNKVNEDNVAFRYRDDGLYGFNGDPVDVILKNYDHAVFYPDNDVVWSSADAVYASPWILDEARESRIRSEPRDDVYCALELIANILSRNGMRKAFQRLKREDPRTLAIIKSKANAEHLFDKDPRMSDDEPLLWRNIYELHKIEDSGIIESMEGVFKDMMTELLGSSEDGPVDYDQIIVQLETVGTFLAHS